MGPAQQGFDAGDLACLEIDLWLVVQLELTAPDGLAELFHEAQSVATIVDVVPVGLEPRRSQLGAIHGEIRAPQQPRTVCGIGGRAGDADAGADAHAHGVELEGFLELGHDASGDFGGVLRVGVHDQHGKFVTPDPHQHVSVSGSELCRRGPSCLRSSSSAGMAERIIDLLEVIEVDVEQ